LNARDVGGGGKEGLGLFVGLTKGGNALSAKHLLVKGGGTGGNHSVGGWDLGEKGGVRVLERGAWD